MSDTYGIIRQNLWRDPRFLGLQDDAKLYYLELRTGLPRICNGLAFDPKPAPMLVETIQIAGLVEADASGYVVIEGSLRDDPPANADHLMKLCRTVLHPSIPPRVQRAWLDIVITVAPGKMEALYEKYPTVGDTVSATVGGTKSKSKSSTSTKPIEECVAPVVATNGSVTAMEKEKARKETEQQTTIADWHNGLIEEIEKSNPKTQEWVLKGLLPAFLSMMEEYYNMGRRRGWTQTQRADFARRMKKHDAFTQVVAMEIVVDRAQLVKGEYVCGTADGIAEDERNGKQTVQRRLTYHRNNHKQGVYARWMQETR